MQICLGMRSVRVRQPPAARLISYRHLCRRGQVVRPASSDAALKVILPRVKDRNACRYEIGYVAGDNGHSVSERGCRNQRVTLGSRVRHMKPGATACDGGIDSVGSARPDFVLRSSDTTLLSTKTSGQINLTCVDVGPRWIVLSTLCIKHCQHVDDAGVSAS